jgi:hypothetical protein
MKIDIKTLAGELRQAEECETVEYGETEPYLIENVFEPCRRGDTPKISDLDYDMFELGDLRVLCNYHERREHISYILAEFNKTLCAAAPLSRAERAFC